MRRTGLTCLLAAVACGDDGGDVGTLYFEDNIVPGGEADNVSNGDALVIPAEAQVTTYGAATLGGTVVPWVGTHFPTDEELALLTEIAAGL